MRAYQLTQAESEQLPLDLGQAMLEVLELDR